MSSTKTGKFAEKNESATITFPEWNPRFSFAKLTDQSRVEIILSHRNALAVMPKSFSQSAPSLDTINPGGSDSLPQHIAELKSITLDDMDLDRTSFGDMIELEIIEDAMSFSRVMLMAQDSAGNVIFVALYCDSPACKDYRLQGKLGYGCRISIANPWMKIALDGRTMIRLDENEALFVHKLKDPKRCRFCGLANAEKKCGRCKKAFYCSRECQTHDWKILKHKVICDTYL